MVLERSRNARVLWERPLDSVSGKELRKKDGPRI